MSDAELPRTPSDEGQRPPVRRRRGRKRLATLLVVLIACVLGAPVAEHTLRVQARHWLEDELGGMIRGQLLVDRIVSLAPWALEVHGVTVVDPQGAVVLTAERLTLVLDTPSLWTSTVRFSAGHIHGARARLIPSQQFAVTLFESFVPVESSEQDDDSPSALTFQFDGVQLHEATLYGDVPGLRGLLVQQVNTSAQLTIGDGFRADIHTLDAQAVAPFERPVQLPRAMGFVNTSPELTLDFRGHLQSGDDRAHVRVAVQGQPGDAPSKLDLLVHTDPLSTRTLIGAGVEYTWWFTGPFAGHARLFGPLDDLRARASVQTPGGHVYAQSGREGNDDTWRIRSDHLRVDKVVQGVPELLLGGAQLDLRVPEEGPLGLQARAKSAQVAGLSFSNLRGRGTYGGERLRLSSARLRHAGGDFNLYGWVSPDGDMQLRIRGGLPKMQRQPNARQTGARGSLTTDLALGRRGAIWNAKGTVQLGALQYGSIRADSVNVSGTARGALFAPRLDVTGSARGLSAGGYPLGKGRFAVRGSRREYDTLLEVTPPDGRQFRADARVRFEPKVVRIDAPKLTLQVPGRDAWRGRGAVALTDRGLRIERFEIGNRTERLTASGRFDYDKEYAVEAALSAFDLGGLRELTGVDAADLEGYADALVQVSGRPDHPIIDVDGTLRKVAFLGLEDLTVGYLMKFQPDRFDLDAELLLQDRSKLHLFAHGTPGKGATWLDELAAGTYRYGADFQRVPLSVARPWLGWIGITPPSGSVSAKLRGQGTLDDPRLNMRTELHALTWDEWPPLGVVLMVDAEDQISVPQLIIGDDRGSVVEVQAHLAASIRQLLQGSDDLLNQLQTRDWELMVSVPERRLDQLPGPLRQNYPLALTASADLQQRAGQPTGALHADLSWAESERTLAACGLFRQPHLTLAGRVREGKAELSVEAVLDNEPFGQGWVRAPLPLQRWLSDGLQSRIPDTEAQLTLNIQETADFPWLCERTAGPLRFEARGKDVLSSDPRWNLVLASPAMQLVPHALQKTRLAGTVQRRAAGRPFAFEARGGVDDKQLGLEVQLDDPDGGHMHAFVAGPKAALTPRAERPPLKAPLSANIDFDQFQLAPILLQLPGELRGSGMLNGKASALLDLDNERVATDGRVRLRDGELQLSALGQHLTDMSGELQFDGPTIRVNRLRVRDFDGLLQLDGTVELQGLASANAALKLRTSAFPIRLEGTPASYLTGTADVTSTILADRSETLIEIDQLRVQLPQKLARELQDLASHPDIHLADEAPPKPRDEDAHLFQVRVLAEDEPFRVQRGDLRADAVADITAWYRGGDLRLRGNAELKRGFAEIYGKRFEVRQSSLALDRDNGMDPLVALQAVHEIGSDEITVRVDGRLSDPQVTFSHSDPAITDRGEIIAQLLGARAAETGGNDVEAAGAAAGFLAGVTAGLLTEEVRRELGGVVPVLSIESGNQGLEDTRIRAGLQLDQFIDRRLGPLRKVVRGAYIEGFVSRSSQNDATDEGDADPQTSSGGGLLELRFPRDLVGAIEYRPESNWRLDFSWEP